MQMSLLTEPTAMQYGQVARRLLKGEYNMGVDEAERRL
jgi:hypothetical protein